VKESDCCGAQIIDHFRNEKYESAYCSKCDKPCQFHEAPEEWKPQPAEEVKCEDCLHFEGVISDCGDCKDHSNFKLWQGAQTVSKEKPSEPQGWEKGQELRDSIMHVLCKYLSNIPMGEKESSGLITGIESLISEREKKAVEVIKEMKNPYPESIFTEPTDKECEIANEVLKSKGLTLDKFSGSMGRKVWENFRKEALKRVEPKSEGKGE
jgi:hypothetical protein